MGKGQVVKQIDKASGKVKLKSHAVTGLRSRENNEVD